MRDRPVAGAGATPPGAADAGPSIEAKLRFLRLADSHPGLAQPPTWLETHMSWVFFAGDQVLKLKKPVRYPFLDFSTLRAREFCCREELRLNARLAPGVYLGLVALQWHDGALALVPEGELPAPGQTVDWLVRMRRLPQQRMLQSLIGESALEPGEVDDLVGVLAAFYRAAPRVGLSGQAYRACFEREQAVNREVLLRPQFDLAGAAHALDRFDAALRRHAGLLDARARAGCVVDGHGDLRPDHVYMLAPPVVIDCLEFNAALRQVDPFDEVAFLALECAMTDGDWVGVRLVQRFAAAWGQAAPQALMRLYTAHRALLRARLAMAHLLDPLPRLPLKWPPLAQRYVVRALAALDALDADVSAATSRGSP